MKLRGHNGRGTGSASRRLLGTLLAAAALLMVPASAQALTVSGTAAPTDTAAGAHSDFNIKVNFGPGGEDVQNLTIGLPPGVTGDPTATPQCTEAQLDSATAGNDGCPADTQVGTVVANATITVVVPLPPLDVSGKLYNLTPHPGEPARFGIVLQPGNLGVATLPVLAPVVLESGAALRQTDFGLDTIINDIPNSTPSPLGDLPTHINSQTITLFGKPADHGVPGTPKPFMRNPTSCTPKVTNFSATPHPPATGTATASSPPFTPTNCASLPFSPSFSASLVVPFRQPAGERPALTTSIDQADGQAGLRNAKVFIPSAMGADLGRLTPDLACLQADFAAGSCPGVSVLGSALATSPVLTAPLTGPVYLLDNPAGVARVGLDLRGQLNLRLQGQLGIDNTTEFTGLPDIPISHFELRFDGGPGGILLTSRDICVPPAPIFHADFTGHNGASTAVDSPATVQGACGATPATKCKKAKKKKHKKRAAEAKKKHKKKSCKKKKKPKKKR
jgi:hypothetical protein